ncbi:MAG: hypothetical protein LBG61_03825 [Burkholderiales bacterium]|jgi:hypothetical protein|nr:hypothetical protein [Burkholderiales bacterium]
MFDHIATFFSPKYRKTKEDAARVPELLDIIAAKEKELKKQAARLIVKITASNEENLALREKVKKLEYEIRRLTKPQKSDKA